MKTSPTKKLPPGVEWWQIQHRPGTSPELNVQVRVCGKNAIARYGVSEGLTTVLRAKAMRALAMVRRGKAHHEPLVIARHAIREALTFESWYDGSHNMVNALGETHYRIGGDTKGRAMVPAEDFSDPELWGPGAGRIESPLLAGQDPLNRLRNACWHVRNARPELDLKALAVDGVAIEVRRLLDGGVGLRQIVGALANGLNPVSGANGGY